MTAAGNDGFDWAEGTTPPCLAQFNVARSLHPYDDARMQSFVRGVALVNGGADRSPGFVWRLADPTGRMNAGEALDEIINLSVWRTFGDLRNFLSSSVHRHFSDHRAKWFVRPGEAHSVMWWVPSDARPSLAEGVARLARLRRDGPTPAAFDWALAGVQQASVDRHFGAAARVGGACS